MLSDRATRRRRSLLIKLVDSLRSHNADRIAYGCTFIIETHLHQSAITFKKELDAGLASCFLFLNFLGLIVIQLYMEWVKKPHESYHESRHAWDAADYKSRWRHTGADFPLKNLWAELLYSNAASVSDLDGDATKEWLGRWGESWVQIVQLEELINFSFKNWPSTHCWLMNLQTVCFQFLLSCVFHLRSTFV